MFEPDKTRVVRMFEFSVRVSYALHMAGSLHVATDMRSDLGKHRRAGH